MEIHAKSFSCLAAEHPPGLTAGAGSTITRWWVARATKALLPEGGG